jgi:hypothetical protein
MSTLVKYLSISIAIYQIFEQQIRAMFTISTQGVWYELAPRKANKEP